MKALRVKQAADYLHVAPQTIRNWCNSGELKHTFNGAGQRTFTYEDLDAYKRARMGLPEPEPVEQLQAKTVFYLRCSSSTADVTLETQQEKLVAQFGEPDHVFTDKASGLNDNRRGLTKLLDTIAEDGSFTVYVTNKDRLSRFGVPYLERLLHAYDSTLVVLDSDDTKEPQEVLLQDFMSLLASFSGKFYRLRGWTQRKKFLTDIQKEVDDHVLPAS